MAEERKKQRKGHGSGGAADINVKKKGLKINEENIDCSFRKYISDGKQNH